MMILLYLKVDRVLYFKAIDQKRLILQRKSLLKEAHKEV